ncbi:hypothetical protein NB693_24745 [Pantoea ananatis]|nr:hypothetical protein [Pantoea ananatis]
MAASVTASHTIVDADVSSNPTTDRSSGTFRRRRCATDTTAEAMSSLLAKIALGRARNPNSRSAASSPAR